MKLPRSLLALDTRFRSSSSSDSKRIVAFCIAGETVSNAYQICNKKDTKMSRLPTKADIDARGLVVLGYLLSYGGATPTETHIGILGAGTTEEMDWICGAFPHRQVTFRAFNTLCEAGLIEQRERKYFPTDKGVDLANQLENIGTIQVQPGPGFNLQPNFGLYYVPTWGLPSLSYIGSLIGIARIEKPTTI